MGENQGQDERRILSQMMNGSQLQTQEPKKRKQCSLACRSCRSAKTRCSDGRPCKRCVRKRIANCVDRDSDHDLELPVKKTHTQRSALAPNAIATEPVWAKSALQRAKELGHARKKTITMLQALPHDLSEVLKEACNAVDVLTLDALTGASAGHSRLSNYPNDSKVLDAAWDAYQDGGILRVSFHPNVSRNMTYAAFVSLLLMHDDETPARPGNHQRFTVYCELEHIALIIDDICRIQEPCVTRYMRMRQSDGMCKLTRVERRQVLDDHGLPSEIQFICTHVAMAEFESERLRDQAQGTSLVRPLMAEIGDTRDATSLVTDMDRDHDALKISNLVMSQQGRDVLSRLATVCRQRLAYLLDLGEQARAAAMAAAASSRPAAPLEASQTGALAPNGSITPEGLVAAVSEAAKQILQNLPRSEATGERLVEHVLGQLNSIVPPPPPPPPPPRPAALNRHVAVHSGFALQSLPSTPLMSSAARSAHAGVSNQVVSPLAAHRSAGQQFASHSHLPVALLPIPTSCGAFEGVVQGSVGTCAGAAAAPLPGFINDGRHLPVAALMIEGAGRVGSHVALSDGQGETRSSSFSRDVKSWESNGAKKPKEDLHHNTMEARQDLNGFTEGAKRYHPKFDATCGTLGHPLVSTPTVMPCFNQAMVVGTSTGAIPYSRAEVDGREPVRREHLRQRRMSDAAVHCLEGFAEEAERLRVEFTANCATDDSV